MTKDNEAFAKENKDARKEMDELESRDEVPSDLSEWPEGRAKNLTFGASGDEPYGEGATAKLGPASVEHHEDGSVSVGGEKVDDPESYKGEPVEDPRKTSIDGAPDPID